MCYPIGMKSQPDSWHHAQASVLHALRHAQGLRFSALMRPTGMESDTFKFHLRKLMADGFVEKTVTGEYRLTSRGKEFANRFDEARSAVMHQPKLSLLVIVQKPGTATGEPVFLFQQRKRNPYFGYWSTIGGPVLWGEDAASAAERELHKQTGMSAACTVRAFLRVRDYANATAELLEDKLFIIVEATEVSGELQPWYGGENRWMTEQEFTAREKHFPSVCDAIRMLRENKMYATKDVHYEATDY